MRKIWKEFWKNIDKALLSSVTVLFTLALGFMWWIFSPGYRIPMWLFSLAILFCYGVCIAVYAVCSAGKMVMFTLPRVKAIRTVGKRPEKDFIFLVEKNDLFAQDSYATITYQDEDDEIEIILGLGRVETTNEQGNLQVVFDRQSESPQAKKILASLSNAKHHRDAVKVKPAISKFLFD